MKRGYLCLADCRHDKVIKSGHNVFPKGFKEMIATHLAAAHVAAFRMKGLLSGE